MFIELTQIIYVLHGKDLEQKICLNVNSIASILHPVKEGNAVIYGENRSFVVKESYDEVKRLISLTGRREVSRPLI